MMTKRISKIDIIAMILLLLSPILGIYGNPKGWSFETLITLPLSFFYFLYFFLMKKGVVGRKDPLPKGMLMYFIYWGIILLLTSLSLPLTVIQGYLFFFFFFATFNLNQFIKFYKLFALFCIVFFFIQEFSYHIVGYRMSGIISSLPLYIDISLADRADTLRSCSFFSEPAHFAQFLLPLLAIELYNNNHKSRYLYVVIIIVTLLLLRSGNGLLGMIVILLFALPYFLRRSNHRFLTALFLSVIAFIGVYYVLNSELGEYFLGRQNELNADWDGQSSRSGFLRIWRGFFVFNDYSFIEKIIGCPNDLDQIIHVNASGMAMVDNAELYFNAFQKVLLNTGLIGIGLFIFILSSLWKNNSTCGKALIASMVALSLVSAIYMSHTMVLFMIIAYFTKKEMGQNSSKNYVSYLRVPNK